MENLNVHAWVADDYKIEKKRKTYRNEKGYYDYYGNIRNRSVYDDDFTITTEFIHMNWGWGKSRQYDSGLGPGWCTYDYWVSDSKNGKNEVFSQNKEMITVNPH